MADNKNINGFDDDSLQNEASQNLEDQYKQVGQKTKNTVKEHSKKYLKNKLGLNTPKEQAANATKKATKVLTNKAKKATKGITKKMTRAMARALMQFAKLLASFLIKAVMALGWWGLAAFAVVAVVAVIAGLVVDNEYSRTNDSSLQHLSVTDANTVMENGLSSNGNVYFNTQTKRYELAKGKMPTQSNRLYYIYYAVMAQQSRWFVQYKASGDPQANGTAEHPYVNKVAVTGDNKKYTMDGYLFNQNELSKGILSSTSAESGNSSVDQLFDEKALAAIKKMSLNANLLYLLDSTLHGTDLGTGKNQMFFSEQFIKPVNHDSNYNFKALTKYRNMTADEKTSNNAVAHGDKIDSSNEKEFQRKYTSWTSMLDTQNQSRGGGNTTAADATKTSGTGTATAGAGNTWAEGKLPAGMSKYVTNPKSLGMGFSNSTGWFNPGNQCVMFSSSYFKNYWKLSQSVMVMLGKDSASDWAQALGGKVSSTPKDGAIASVPGNTPNEAPYPAGHTFIVSHVFENGDILIIEQNYAGLSGEANGTSCTWSYRLVKKSTYTSNHFTFFTPSGKSPAKGGSESTSSDSTDSGGSSKVKVDVSMSTPNTYKDQYDTGVVDATSRVFDTQYSPDIINDLYQYQFVNKRVWRDGDFYISQSTNNNFVNWDAYANATGNSKFSVGSGAKTSKSGKAVASDEKDDLLGTYKADRGSLTSFSIKSKYNPAFIAALVSVLTEKGDKNLTGSKYNFLNDPKVASEASKTKTNDNASSKSSSSSSSTNYDASYGASEYNYTSSINNIDDGLSAMMAKYLKDNNSADSTKGFKNLDMSSDNIKDFYKLYIKFGGSVFIVKTPNSESKILTYAGTGATDPNALGSIETNGKNNYTTVDGQKHYYVEKEPVSTGSGVKASETGSSSDHPYAIARDSKGNAKTTTGIWDYGFGTIFKIMKKEYKAWEISVDKEGNYSISSNIWGNIFYDGSTNSDVQYTLLGVTSPFGTINIGNKLLEDQQKVDNIIYKLRSGQNLTTQDKAFLQEHKTTEVSAKKEGNFVVADKPVIQDNDVVLSDMNGSNYLVDYLTNYKTYIPQNVDQKLDVVQRWKQMNDANASAQNASNNIDDIFNKLVSNNANSSTGTEISTGSSGDLQGDEKKHGQTIYDSLTKYGMSSYGAASILGNWSVESSWDPTAVGGVYTEPFTIGPAKQSKVNDTTTPIGLGQWLGARKTNLLAYAKKQGKPWTDIEVQISFALTQEPAEKASIIKVAQINSASDVSKGAEIMFREWERAGDSTLPNRQAAAASAYTAYAKGHDKSADLNKLNGATGNSTNSSSTSTDNASSSSVTSNWGDGRSLLSLIYNFVSSLSNPIFDLFGSKNTDPTMFATDRITNSSVTYDKNSGKQKTYYPNDLIVSGADAYKWSVYTKNLSQGNAAMVLRQFVAELETRDARPVYYDEVYDKFNGYDLGRIVEENYKNELLGVFKYTGDTSSASDNAIKSKLFNGVELQDTLVKYGYGYYKQDGKLKFNPGMTFSNKKQTKVLAMKPGKVVYVGENSDYGTIVIIRSDGNSEQIAYTGLNSKEVKVNQQIQVGQTLGKSASDGSVTVLGIPSDTNVSNGLPDMPKSIKGTIYFDPASLFNISVNNENTLIKKANGYDQNNISGSDGKPSLKNISSTSYVPLKDVSK